MHTEQPDVALFIRSFHGGGAEKVMLYIAQNFVKYGLKVDLILPRAEGEYLEQIPPEVRLIDLKTPWIPASLPKLVNYLRQYRPKTLLAALHYTAEIAIAAKYLARVKTKIVIAEQNTLSVEAASSPQLSVRLNPLAAKIFYPWADEIVAVSQGVAEDLAKTTGLPRERIKLIYNPGLNEEILNKSQAVLAHPWFREGEPPVILGVGRLHYQKDFLTLIRAFARVRKLQTARLVILGAGPQEAELKNLVRELGLTKDVDFPGFVQNPYAYMAKAEVFVLSSIYEGLGIVLVEAMALGTPIVSSNCPHGPAEVLDGGKYGSLVPVGDEKAMANSILEALDTPQQAATPEWLQQFTVENCIEQYLKVLGFAQNTYSKENYIEQYLQRLV